MRSASAAASRRRPPLCQALAEGTPGRQAQLFRHPNDLSSGASPAWRRLRPIQVVFARIAYDAVVLMAVTAGGERLSLKSELPPLSLKRTTIAALCATPTHTARGSPLTTIKGPAHARSTHIGESGRIARHRSLAGCHAGCPEAHIWYVRTRPVEERVSSLSSTASSRASLGISHLLRLCAASVQLFLSALPAAARAG